MTLLSNERSLPPLNFTQIKNIARGVCVCVCVTQLFEIRLAVGLRNTLLILQRESQSSHREDFTENQVLLPHSKKKKLRH